MPPIKLIQALLQQAIAEGSRSTALKPLGWLLAMLPVQSAFGMGSGRSVGRGDRSR
jgi:hypothetical protein